MLGEGNCGPWTPGKQTRAGMCVRIREQPGWDSPSANGHICTHMDKTERRSRTLAVVLFYVVQFWSTSSICPMRHTTLTRLPAVPVIYRPYLEGTEVAAQSIEASHSSLSSQDERGRRTSRFAQCSIAVHRQGVPPLFQKEQTSNWSLGLHYCLKVHQFIKLAVRHESNTEGDIATINHIKLYLQFEWACSPLNLQLITSRGGGGGSSSEMAMDCWNGSFSVISSAITSTPLDLVICVMGFACVETILLEDPVWHT